MQIFPSIPFQSMGSAHAAFGSEATLFSEGNDNFENIIGMLSLDEREQPLSRTPQPAVDHPEMPNEGDRNLCPQSENIADECTWLSPRQQELSADREDFASLRRKLEDLGMDQETLERVETLFDSAEVVTWDQVMNVIRGPLHDLTNVDLNPEQEMHLISFMNKIGFTPERAKQLVLDLVNKNHNAVWKNIQQILSMLSSGEKISVTPAEISALLQALGLNAGVNKVDAVASFGELFGLSQKSIENAQPKSIEAMQVLVEVMKKSGMETSPELNSVVHKALQENADIIHKVLEAAAKGELKLDPETLTKFLSELKQSGNGSTAMSQEYFRGDLKIGSTIDLNQIIRDTTEKELTPEELKKILAVLKEAATAAKQDRNGLLTELQRVVAASENREFRMQATDNGPNAHRLSMNGAINALQNLASEGGERNPGLMDHQTKQEARWKNPFGQDAMKKSSQGWESFWNKINFQGNGEVSAGLIKDVGPDPRSALGQVQAATHAEAAARRVLTNAPAPHRSVLNQVSSGLLQNLGQGRQQLTLQLHPADLGSLTVKLRVVGKEVQAVLRADNPEARQVIAENMPYLRQSLESHGLRVTRLEVQTQLQDQNQFTHLWQGTDGQKFQEHAANTQWASLARGLLKNRESSSQEISGQASILLDPTRDGGINLIA